MPHQNNTAGLCNDCGLTVNQQISYPDCSQAHKVTIGAKCSCGDHVEDMDWEDFENWIEIHEPCG